MTIPADAHEVTLARLDLLDAGLMLVALAVALCRIFGMRHPAFQAAAHLYVGGLLGAYAAGRDRAPLLIAVALSLVEVACFLIGTAR